MLCERINRDPRTYQCNSENTGWQVVPHRRPSGAEAWGAPVGAQRKHASSYLHSPIPQDRYHLKYPNRHRRRPARSVEVDMNQADPYNHDRTPF